MTSFSVLLSPPPLHTHSSYLDKVWHLLLSTVVAVTVITSNSGLPPLYFIKHYVTFTTFPSEMITAGQDQEFSKTDMVKQHLQQQCIQYNYTLLKWVTFQDKMK